MKRMTSILRTTLSLMIVGFSFQAIGQVKVGANPTIITANSGLEVEATNGSKTVITKDLGNVGIGTLTPSARLEVAGQVKITGGTPGAGKILMSDAVGLATWEQPKNLVGVLHESASAVGTSPISITSGVVADLPGVTVTINPTTNVRVFITTSALPLPLNSGQPVQGTIDLFQNGVKIASQYYSANDAPTTLVRLGNYSTITKMIDLVPGTYTFKVGAKSWFNTTGFNTDPVANGYGGASGIDANAMKGNILVICYTR